MKEKAMASDLDLDREGWLPLIRSLHQKIRDAVLQAAGQAEPETLSRIAAEEESGDTIYAVDRIGESVLVPFLETFGRHLSFVLIAEGLAGGKLVFPRGISEEEARWRIIMDPIDGTRCLMYQKRSAWILTAVAPNQGPQTGLQDILLAVQTEIPLCKQHLCDSLWARRGAGAWAARQNRLSGQESSLTLCPSRSRSIAHGYAMLTRFFPGAREILADIDEEIVFQALGPAQAGKAHCFEDQYTSTGGQLYELMAGHDRFNADLRPLLETVLQSRGLRLGICCHPYDICTELIAREMGVIVTDPLGGPLKAPLSVDPDVAWIGYANRHIREQMEPLVQQALRRRGLLGA